MGWGARASETRARKLHVWLVARARDRDRDHTDLAPYLSLSAPPTEDTRRIAERSQRSDLPRFIDFDLLAFFFLISYQSPMLTALRGTPPCRARRRGMEEELGYRSPRFRLSRSRHLACSNSTSTKRSIDCRGGVPNH